MGLVGESGSGKTMLARSILKLLPHSLALTGEALLDGIDLISLSTREMRHIRGHRVGIIFQHPGASFNPLSRVGDQLVETIRTYRSVRHRRAWQRGLELLDEVGLPDASGVMRAYPHQLSGGMLQRVCIASALAGAPDLLIADEPTTALDQTLRIRIVRRLHSIRQRRAFSTLLISHDLGVIANLADRIAVLYAGRLVEIGRADQVLTAPSHPFTRGPLASRSAPYQSRSDDLPAVPGPPPERGSREGE